MSRIDDIIKRVNENGTEKKKTRVESIIEKVSKGGINTGVDERYINTFLSDANTYFSNASNDFKNVGYGNASSLYDNYSSRGNELRSRANTIRAYLNSNKNNIDESTHNDMMSTLDNFDRDSENIYKNFRKSSEYFSKWETEEEYNKVVADAAETERLLSLDTDALSSEIDELRSIYDRRINSGMDEETMTEFGNMLLDKASKAKTDTVYVSMQQLQDGIKLGRYHKVIGSDNSYTDTSGRKVVVGAAPTEAYNFQTGKKEAFNPNLVEQDPLKSADLYGINLGMSNDELLNAINSKTKELNNAKRFQRWQELSSVYDNEDFHEYNGINIEFAEDDTYKFINNIDGYQDNIKSLYLDNATYNTDSGVIYPTSMPSPLKNNYDKLTKKEIGIYNYLYATSGKEVAEEYLDSVAETLNTRRAKELRAEFDTFSEQLLFSVVAGPDQWQSGAEHLFDNSKDYYAPSANQIASGMIKEDLVENHGKGWGTVYDVFNTTSNMLPSILTSTALGVINPALGTASGLAMMGGSTYGNSYAEMVNLGYSKKQASAYATLTAGSEVGLSYLLGGFGKLGGKLTGNAISKFTTKVVSNIDNAFARIAIGSGSKIVGNAIGEFGEEYLQEILTPVFKNIALGTHEDFKLYTPDALYAGFLGALSSTLLEGGGAVIGEISDAKQISSLGKNVIDSGVKDSLVNFGKSLSVDSVAYKIANKVNENTGAYAIGRILQEAGASLSATNMADIQKSLVRKGVSTKDAQTISEWLNKAVMGEEFSAAQISALEDNEVISQTFRDVIFNQKSTVNQRTGQYLDIVNSIEKNRGNKDVKSANAGVDGGGENRYNINRGDNYANEYTERRTTSRGNFETEKAENSGGRSTGKSVRRESKESFLRRLKGNAPSLGGRTRRVVGKGKFMYSFVPVAPDNSNGGRATKYLESLGVKVVFCDGPIEKNDGEKTFTLTTAFTTKDGTVYISSESTLSDIETALHEIVHVKEVLKAEEFYKYESVIKDNLNVSSDTYEALASEIYKAYILDNLTEEERSERWKSEEELDNYIREQIYSIDNGFYEVFVREISAYINQYVATDEQKANRLFSGLFNNWDAVVQASRQFNKDIGADFSESASFMPENESVLPEVSAKGPEADPVADSVFEAKGLQRLTEDQKFIKRVGKAFGREVRFDNLDEWRTDENGKRYLFSPGGKFDKSTGIIYINTSENNSENPISTIFKHELTHFAETAMEKYVLFANEVMKSQAFKDWVYSKGFRSDGDTSAVTAMNTEYIKRWKFKGKDAEHKANLEMVADFVAENLFTKKNGLAKLEKAINELKPKEIKTFKDWILSILAKLKSVFQKRGYNTIDQIEREFVRLCDEAMKAWETKTDGQKENSTEGGEEYSFKGYAEDGKGKYESNFPKGTPKAAKAERILQYIKNVWSKNPIRLKIAENGETRYIEAKFDPTYHAEEGNHTDASKLMGGNRHGTSSEQRVTLDLADDYYQIASESQYNYSKDETGKDNPTHKDVIKWHYFINDIYFAEYGSKDYEPYRVSINVKERADGDYVYSFSAEKQRESNTPRTLHAVVNEGDNSNANVQLSNNRVAQKEPSVNSYSMPENEKYSQDGDIKFSFAGEKAATADKSLLLRAKEMLERGESQKKIRKDTGWFKHHDGKWRFEIDDSKMQVDPTGKINGKTQTKGVKRLADFVKHDDLFRAYPELKDITVVYSLFSGNTSGQYDKYTKTITLDFGLYNDIHELKKVLIHEIQHAIQHIESFTSGSSMEYWQTVLDNTNELYRNFQQITDRNIEILREKMGDDSVQNLYTVANGLSHGLNTEVEELSQNMIKVAKRNGCYKHYEKTLFAVMKLNRLETTLAKYDGRSAKDLYLATAGEIEAIDAMERWDLTEDERRSTPPDTNRDDVVFADDNVSYSMSNYVDTYTEEQYNNFGWVRYNNVLSANEYNTLLSRYADYKHNKDKYPTTRFGEAVIHSTECPDVIMYVKGTITSPEITKTIKINADSLDSSTIKEWILQNEYGRVSQPYGSIEDFYGQEIFSKYRKRDFTSFQGYRAEAEGSGSQTSNTFGTAEQNRAGSTKQNTSNDGAGLNESAFSMPENEDVQYSVGLTDTEEFDTIAFAKELIAKHGESTLKQKNIADMLDGIYYDVLNSQWSEAYVDIAKIAESFNNVDISEITNNILNKVSKAHEKAIVFANEHAEKIKQSAAEQENKRLKSSLDGAKERIRTLEDQRREAESTSKKRKDKENPISIARLKPNAANTTPFIERQTGNAPGNKQSNFYENMQGSSIFDERFKEDMKNDDYIKTYNSTTNKETLKKAVKALETGGQKYVTEWFQKPTDEASLLDITVGLLLIDRYQRVGNTEGAIATAQRVREMGTASGQQVQIFSIIGRFDPNTMAAYAQKELNTAYELLVKGKTNKWIEANKKKFELTPDEIEGIRRRTLQAAMLPECRTKAVLLAEICTMLQNKIPPESGQSIRAWQRIAMLLNVKTNIRNIVGNAGMVPIYIASDYFGSLIDKVVAKKTNVRTTGISDPIANAFSKDGKEHLSKMVKGFSKGLYESYDDFKRGIHTKQEELNRYAVEGFDAYRAKGDIKHTVKKREGIAQGGKSFNENTEYKVINAIAKKLNALDSLTSFCLEVGDRPFFEMWFMNSLNNQLRLNKVTEPTVEMIDIATQDALQRTWQDESKMAKMVANLKKSANTFHLPGTSYGVGDFIFKFTKTPANIAKAIVDFSPIGLFSAGVKAYDMANAIKTAQFTPQMQRDFVKTASNAITGTLVYALVIVGASLGFVKLSGAGDDDKDAANFEKYIVGIPPYSIEMFGTNVTYDWFQPFGSTLAISAAYMENRNDPETSWDKDILDAFVSAGTVFTEQSFLKSLNEFFKAVEADGNIFMGLLDMAISDPSVNIPTLFSQVGSFLDEDRRSTYDATSDFKTMINGLMSKLPGVRKLLPEQINVLGEDVENNQYLDPWRAFVSPYNEYPESSGEVANKIYELYKSTGDKTVIPRVAPNYITVKGKKYRFDTEEKSNYQRKIGTASAEMLDILFNSDFADELTEKQMIEVVNKIYDYSTKLAKIKVVSEDYDYDLLSDMVGLDKRDKPILTEKKYNTLTEDAKLYIIQDYMLSKAELKFKTQEDAVKYFVKQVRN